MTTELSLNFNPSGISAELLRVTPFSKDLPESEKAMKIWSSTREQLLEILGQETFDQWIYDTMALGIIENKLVVQTKNQLDKLWIKNNFVDLIKTLLCFQRKDLDIYLISQS